MGSAASSPQAGPAVVTVLGRCPEPGRVKTRLAASLGDRAACEVHEALALDVLARLRDWIDRRGGRDEDLVLALTGDELAGRGLERTARGRFGARVERQSGGDLGDRIREALARRGAEGAAGSLVVGTDAPLLDDELLDAAAGALRAGRTGIAPSSDGGFVLLAARPFPAEVFAGVPWGRSGVLAAVTAGLAGSGLDLDLLPGSEDVDDEGDLRRLAEELRGKPERAPATSRWLAARSSVGKDG